MLEFVRRICELPFWLKVPFWFKAQVAKVPVFSRHSAQPDFPCHVGSGDRTASVGMRRGLLRGLVTHAALTCSGATPRYFTPGFGPLALAWRWLLLGVLLGLLFRRAAAALVAKAGGYQTMQATGSWEALLREHLACTRDPHREAVLQYLLEGGDAALHEVSGASGHASCVDGPPTRRRNGTCGCHHCRSPAWRAAVKLAHDPWKGVRVGEASQPGLSCENPSPRARALAALAHLGLDGDAGDAAAGQSDAETVSDTLSAHTAIASPPHTPQLRAHHRAHTGRARGPRAWRSRANAGRRGDPGVLTSGRACAVRCAHARVVRCAATALFST